MPGTEQCHAGGQPRERPSFLGSRGRVSYLTLQNAQRHSPQRKQARLWAGPRAWWRNELFWVSFGTGGREEALLICSHTCLGMAGCGHGCPLRRGLPLSQPCFPELLGGSSSRVTILVVGNNVNLGDCEQRVPITTTALGNLQGCGPHLFFCAYL